MCQYQGSTKFIKKTKSVIMSGYGPDSRVWVLFVVVGRKGCGKIRGAKVEIFDR